MIPFPIGLSIAGFDGSGGAGMQADMKVFSALGVYAATVLTSLPIQNTTGVRKVYDLPLESIEEQIDCLFEDLEIQVVKIGMLHKTSIIETVSQKLLKYKPNYIIVDPVMFAKSGHRLLEPDAIHALKELIIPIANVITPNLPEAEELAGRKIKYNNKEEYIQLVEKMADEILNFRVSKVPNSNPRCIVLKGGHTEFLESMDLLLMDSGVKIWESTPKIQTQNTHGTGCTFSSAMAAYLARGFNITDAFKKSKKYIYEAIVASKDHRIGKGKGPVHFFWNVWKN